MCINVDAAQHVTLGCKTRNVAIIFGSFENITILQRFNLEILLDESG